MREGGCREDEGTRGKYGGGTVVAWREHLINLSAGFRGVTFTMFTMELMTRALRFKKRKM